MLKKIDTETRIGGLSAIVAIVAAIIEMYINGFTSVAIASGVKDIAGTMVAVLVFLFAVRNIWPKVGEETYEHALENGFNVLISKYEPLLIKAIVNEKTDDATKKLLTKINRYNLLTKFEWLLKTGKSDDEIKNQGSTSNRGGTVGRFIDFDIVAPKYADFFMNQSTFGKKTDDEDNFEVKRDVFSAEVASCINVQYKNFCKAKHSSLGVHVQFLKSEGLNNPDDARKLIELVEYVLMLYIVRYKY